MRASKRTSESQRPPESIQARVQASISREDAVDSLTRSALGVNARLREGQAKGALRWWAEKGWKALSGWRTGGWVCWGSVGRMVCVRSSPCAR